MHGRYRLRGFDYRANRWYFVTVVTVGREHLFGHIDGVEIQPSSIGLIVEGEISLLVQRRPKVRIPISVVMPNHVHLMVGLENEGKHEEPNCFQQVMPDSLAAVIGGWKSGVVRRARREGAWGGEELWQRRFHDRVVRNLDEWEGIADYILWNPVSWHLDPLNESREPTDEEINDWKRRHDL